MAHPTPHGDKLRALLENVKLPENDRPRIESAVEKYDAWIVDMKRVTGSGNQLVERLTETLNRYKQFVDLNLVFDSGEDFLYRQKGQLKLDNTVLEEFLPWLVGRVFADSLADLGLTLGPTNAFSQVRFDSHVRAATAGGGMAIRSKNHDFALARPLFLKASHYDDFRHPREARTHLAYVAAEVKTNLDKTMFQEASATAYDLKLALPNSRYLVLCEWLDMIPISTAVTAIEEVIVLRKARRIPADVRARFSTSEGRSANRDLFEEYLTSNPFRADAFRHFLTHLERLLNTPAAARLLDLTVSFHAAHGAVTFGDTKEGGLCALRVRDDLTEPRGGIISNAYGALGEAETWGGRAPWVDYSGSVADPAGVARNVGVAIFDHPRNPFYPTHWHVRGYGLFAANPFGLADYGSGYRRRGDWTLAAGERATFRYRVLWHAGDAAAARVGERFPDWAHPPVITAPGNGPAPSRP